MRRKKWTHQVRRNRKSRSSAAFNNSYFDTVVDEERWDLFNRNVDDGGESDTTSDQSN